MSSKDFPPPPDCPQGFIYTVKPSDSLYKIAKQFNIPLKKLKKANPQIKDPNRIFPGQKICVPKKKPKKDVVKLLKKILALLEDEGFGLKEIKDEIANIEGDIPELLAFLNTIVELLESEDFGLKEIKVEVREIQKDVKKILKRLPKKS